MALRRGLRPARGQPEPAAREWVPDGLASFFCVMWSGVRAWTDSQENCEHVWKWLWSCPEESRSGGSGCAAPQAPGLEFIFPTLPAALVPGGWTDGRIARDTWKFREGYGGHIGSLTLQVTEKEIKAAASVTSWAALLSVGPRPLPFSPP